MRLEEHIADTLKEWELKLGKIDGGIRLYYPCDSVREYLEQACAGSWREKAEAGSPNVKTTTVESSANSEMWQQFQTVGDEDLAECVRQYLQAEAAYLGAVKTEYHEGRIAVQIPEEGCQYVAEQMEYPELLVRLLPCLKEGSLEKIRALFETYAREHGGQACEDQEEEDLGCVLYFDRDEVDPYVYCFDADDFGVTYHRFARADYEKLV